MQHLATFILSEGAKYQRLTLAGDDIHPSKAPGSVEDGLDGWAFMMRTPEKDFALLYFENKAVLPGLSGFKPDTGYSLQWFDPVNGKWKPAVPVKSDNKGILVLAEFSGGQTPLSRDWAAKIKRR